MVDVRPHVFFPTNIHEIKMNINAVDIKNMTSYMSVKKSVDGKIPNYNDDDLHTTSIFKPLANEVINCSKAILEKYEYEFEDVEITSMWGNVLKKGFAHAPHTHSNNFLSGVYYLQSGSPIQFFDPRPASHVLSPRKSPNWDNSGMVQFNSVVDTALFFPSWLMHWVPPTPNERISIAWNILVRGHYGEPNTLQNAYI